jgi:hypothetical protein
VALWFKFSFEGTSQIRGGYNMCTQHQGVPPTTLDLGSFGLEIILINITLLLIVCYCWFGVLHHTYPSWLITLADSVFMHGLLLT